MKLFNTVGLVLFIAGALLLISFTLFKILEDVLSNANTPTVVTVGIVGLVLGTIIILISLVIERRRDSKKGE